MSNCVNLQFCFLLIEGHTIQTENGSPQTLWAPKKMSPKMKRKRKVCVAVWKTPWEHNELSCILYKRTSYTAKKKWLSVQYKSIKLCWYKGFRPDPHLKMLSPKFFWMRHCDAGEPVNDFLGIFPLIVFKLGH